MYEWLKALHVIAIVAWMAGLFYLPRLFVYHAVESVGSGSSETFKVMERRLLKAIMRPASLVSVGSGLGVWHILGYSLNDTWLVMKLLGVFGMIGFHGLLEVHAAKFGRDDRPGSASFYRIINEIPTVLLIWIVIWVVVKPFS